nr:cytochrome P450 347B4 [Pagiophloeus tsushimanus]
MYGVLLASFVVLLVLWFKIWSHHWIKRGVPGPKPWPLVGNIAEHIFGRKTIGQVLTEIYRKYNGYPFVGVFRATTPCLLVRDPEFVNKILVKDHKSFYNNDFYIDKVADPLFGQNPFVLRDQDWKDTRQMLTPGFTSGKMKHLYQILHGIADKFTNFIEHHPTAATDGINTRELAKRYTLDNVAKAAFGIDGKSFESYTELSEFMKIANEMLSPGSLSGIMLQLNAVLPFLGRLLSVKMVPKDVEHKLVGIVSDVVKHRTENNVQSNDYFQFILQLAKEKGLSDSQIAAHGVTFFFDGYETSSNILTSLLLNLAINPKYQEKIRQEIKKVEEENGNGISYETLSEMKWMDACINETMRISPFFDIFVKLCTQPYEYTPNNPEFKKISVKLYPGDTIILPYSMLMNDEKYFDNPKKFFPERFLDKDSINKSCFFPFGGGPRACIGQRFGQMQLKLGAAQVIKHFEISLSPKTKFPLKFVPFNFLNEVKGGVWLRYKKIN